MSYAYDRVDLKGIASAHDVVRSNSIAFRLNPYAVRGPYLEVPEHPLLAQFFFRVHDFFHYRFISFHDS